MLSGDTTIQMPLGVVMSLGGTGLLTVAGGVYWVLNTFYRKSEAIELEKRIEAKFNDMAKTVVHVEQTCNQVAKDTSFIRGWIAGKEKKGD